jgi:hypothetical protein
MGQQSSPQRDGSILDDVRTIFRSPLLKSIRQAFASNVEAKVRIGRYYIQYEPGIPPGKFSAITDFEGNGFTVARDAFKSEGEFRKTLLHEVYRLRTSAKEPVEAGHKQQRIETDAAFRFAERYYSQL